MHTLLGGLCGYIYIGLNRTGVGGFIVLWLCSTSEVWVVDISVSPPFSLRVVVEVRSGVLMLCFVFERRMNHWLVGT